MTAIDRRVWAKVTRGDGCWEWTGHVNWSGYGVITDQRRKYYVHRVAWEAANGPIPAGRCVLHSCDNRVCCRPSHLRLGSRRENSDDMVARNRSGKGEAHSQVVLTETSVRAIRACREAGMTQVRIAVMFGVSRSLVGLICQRQRWAHVA